MEEEPQNCPMRQALQNPIILQQIFQNKAVPGKTSRLVCHLWNEITLSLPDPKLTLRLTPKSESSSEEKGCCYASPFQLFCIKMSPRLARSIVESGCQSIKKHPRTHRICAAESKLLHISGQFAQFMEHLTMSFSDRDLIPILYAILKNGCPNLKRLELDCGAKKFFDVNDKLVAPLRTQAKLTSLEISDDSKCSGFLKMTQLILNSAPNLTRFTYRGRKYPDLSLNNAITWIKLEFLFTETNSIPSCTGPQGLNKMLDQVKDHLEYFHVDSDEYEVENTARHVARIGFQFPKMKKLKEFRSDMLDCFTCGDHLQDICTARIPSLEILRISKRDNTVDDLLRNSIQKQDLFSGVKNLSVENVRNPESITGLKAAFPNLESLSIYQFNEDESSPLMEIGSHLKVCAGLGLKHLKLDLSNHHEKLSEFVRGFLICEELLSSLKTLEVELYSRVSDDLDLVEDGEAQMERCLLGTKGLENVIISGIEFKEETWQWVELFISENKIPIIFSNKLYPSITPIKDLFLLQLQKYTNAVSPDPT